MITKEIKRIELLFTISMAKLQFGAQVGQGNYGKEDCL